MVTYHSARLLMNSLLLQRDGEEQDFVSIIVVTMGLRVSKVLTIIQSCEEVSSASLSDIKPGAEISERKLK
jgi:negative regulator of sigma E activity